MSNTSDFSLRLSPNGVDHLMVRGRCATCGLGPHDDWPAVPFLPDTVADAFRLVRAQEKEA